MKEHGHSEVSVVRADGEGGSDNRTAVLCASRLVLGDNFHPVGRLVRDKPSTLTHDA